MPLPSSIQDALPTCQRCHRLRRKCDTQLPACRTCEKAGVECMMFDPGLQEYRARSYVRDLLTRLERLQAVKRGTPGLLETTADAQHPSPMLADTVGPGKRTLGRSFSLHTMLSLGRDTTSRFFGASSVIPLTVEILCRVCAKGLISIDELSDDMINFRRETNADQQYTKYERMHDLDDLQPLITSYFTSVNLCYDFLDPTAIQADLERYRELIDLQSFQPQHLRGIQAHQYFRICMVCAIASANRARYEPLCATRSLAFYNEALKCVEEVTSEVSPESLRALLLLIVFCLFYPKTGDVWRLLDYACRLCTELGYHTEPSLDMEDESTCKIRRSTFWALYTIERTVGQLFGRCSDLPEATITVNYPNGMQCHTVESSEDPQMGQIVHQHRLMWIRAGIYRELYLPAQLPRVPIAWHQEHYAALLAWRQEQQASDDGMTVASVCCDVEYSATVCFLFQSVMMGALSQMKGDEVDDTEPWTIPWVPHDNFYGACDMIQLYEKIVRAPQNSPMGEYPLTFLSAHNIYLAGLTVMVHSVLALDRQSGTIDFTAEPESESRHRPLDFSNLSKISGSCLILLGWCAGRWPEMVAMLNVYKILSDRVIPALIRKGIA